MTSFWADTARWLAAADRKPHMEREVELVPPVPASARVICIGLNYRAHAAEVEVERLDVLRTPVAGMA